MTDGLSEAWRISQEAMDRMKLYCEICPDEKQCINCTDWKKEIEPLLGDER